MVLNTGQRPWTLATPTKCSQRFLMLRLIQTMGYSRHRKQLWVQTVRLAHVKLTVKVRGALTNLAPPHPHPPTDVYTFVTCHRYRIILFRPLCSSKAYDFLFSGFFNLPFVFQRIVPLQRPAITFSSSVLYLRTKPWRVCDHDDLWPNTSRRSPIRLAAAERTQDF